MLPDSRLAYPPRLLRPRERIDQISGLQFRWIQDHLFPGLAKLVDVVTLDILILDVEEPGLNPLADFIETDRANNSAERVFVHVAGDLFLVHRAYPCNSF